MTGQSFGGNIARLGLGEVIVDRLVKGLPAVAIVAAILMPASGLTSRASAQSFTQALVFGDSSVDSGFYKAVGSPGGAIGLRSPSKPPLRTAGHGAPTNTPGLMNSQILAGFFGLTANPANQPGGTNFATSGAKDVLVNTPANGGFLAAVPRRNR